MAPTNNDDSADYDVGYCKPPRHSRFKPGQSGNPSGRKRGAKNTATLLNDALNQRIQVTRNGRVQKMTVKEAIVNKLIQDGLKGATADTVKVAKMVDDLLPEQFEAPPPEPVVVRFTRAKEGRPDLYTEEEWQEREALIAEGRAARRAREDARLAAEATKEATGGHDAGAEHGGTSSAPDDDEFDPLDN